jgi:PTH1 family peptidyl-tRNA hydrolase
MSSNEDSRQPSSEKSDSGAWLIIGLGNPGEDYAETYHNVGFRVVEKMAARYGVSLELTCGPANISRRVRIGGQEAVLVLPQTFMNKVGSCLPRLFERFESSCKRIIAVYDDIALPVGKLRVRHKGSAGGHNGVKSLILACGSDEFLRVRVGVLPERTVGVLRDFVLSRVSRTDRRTLDAAEAATADAVETLLAEGPEKAMAMFNGMDLRETKEN